jgi:hypothetical protein
MITFFTIPKPFRGHIDIIQKNALASWKRMQPACEILILGDEFGAKEAAAEFGARLLPELPRNARGTPLVSAAFQAAAREAAHAWLCYVNADIILPSAFPTLLRAVRSPKTLFVGQRWNLALSERFDFQAPGAEERLRALLRQGGELFLPNGMDYFLLRKESPLTALPPFAVGRPYWDCWLIYRARQLGYAVVDATAAAPVIHQQHDYRHVPGGTGASWQGPEAEEQLALLGSLERCFSVWNATHVWRNGAIRLALEEKYLRGRLRAFPVLHPVLGWPLAVARDALRAARRLLGLKGGCI